MAVNTMPGPRQEKSQMYAHTHLRALVCTKEVRTMSCPRQEESCMHAHVHWFVKKKNVRYVFFSIKGEEPPRHRPHAAVRGCPPRQGDQLPLRGTYNLCNLCNQAMYRVWRDVFLAHLVFRFFDF